MEQKIKLNSGAVISVPDEVTVLVSGNDATTSLYCKATEEQLHYALSMMVKTILTSEGRPGDIVTTVMQSISNYKQLTN